MKQLQVSKETTIKVFNKLIYVIALIYILYYVACSVFSLLGLLTNGVNDLNGVILLTFYIIIILYGLFVAQFKFRFDLVFIFALLVQVVF